ncbi:MAG: DUF3108 domain-containing protein [Chromatiaceae bacterium]|nr:DUF3108 domain-containing protein [Chromatiaceae bacterium]
MKLKPGSVLPCILLLLLLQLQAVQSADGLLQAGGETLVYKVTYQGLLSAFLPVEIAQTTLRLHPGVETVAGEQLRHASLRVTTEPFPRMESFYPFRFDYHSWFDPRLSYTAVVDMRKRTSDSRHELLWFNRREGEVRRYRKEQQTEGADSLVLPDFVRQVIRLQQTAGFRERGVFRLTESNVLDRLTMLYAVRHRPLQTGGSIELAVSNGKDLLGYNIAIEAKEKLIIDGRPIAAFRLRFSPNFVSAGDRGYAVRVWLSDDERRLPIRFHSRNLGGVIELELTTAE